MSATFVIVSVIAVAAALGVLFARKAVHAALLIAVVMIGLAFVYASLEAPFLFAVQIVVYTGAILMLFLFVLMLVGVDAEDELKETIAGHRVLAVIAGVALLVLLLTVAGQASVGTMRGLAAANAGGNIPAIANLLFSRYIIAFEVTSALLISAALGAMVLAHRERFAPRRTQRDIALDRIARNRLNQGVFPGTLANHNGVETPALLPDGKAVEGGVRPKELEASDD